MPNTQVGFKAKCVGCGKVYVPTQKEIEEGNDFGCLMSPCCMMPATVEQVSVNTKKARSARR